MAKICPSCKQRAGLVRRSYPSHVEEYIGFYNKNKNDNYYIDDPIISEDYRIKDEYSCVICGYSYKGNDIDNIILDEMVEEDGTQ